MYENERTSASAGDYTNDAYSKGYGSSGESFDRKDGFQGFQGYYDNSGFEEYSDYRGPNPFYRGYEGNAGNNPIGTVMNRELETAPDAPSMPDYSLLNERPEDAFYKGYDAPAPMKYKPGMENEYPEPSASAAPAVYEMPFYHFAAFSHIWSAGGLFMMFLVSSGISLSPPLLPKNINGFYYKLIISAVCIILYILSGYIARKMTQKMSDQVLSFFLLLYGGVSGIFISIPLKCIFGEMLGVLSFSYLASALAIVILSAGSLMLKYNLLNIPASLLAIGISCMTEFAVCHYAGTTNAEKFCMIIMTSVILGFAAFETITVQRTYEEYIVDDSTMKRNMIIAAIGHYVSFATLILSAAKNICLLSVRFIKIIFETAGRNGFGGSTFDGFGL